MTVRRAAAGWLHLGIRVPLGVSLAGVVALCGASCRPTATSINTAAPRPAAAHAIASPCPLPSAGVRTIAWTAESVQLPVLPAGFAVTSGSSDALTSLPVTWGVTGNTAGPRMELRRYLGTAPATTFVSISGTPVTIHGGAGLVAGNPAATASAGLSEIVAWHETSSVVLTLTGYGISAADMMDVATALVYSPGGPGPLVVASTPDVPTGCRVLPDGAQPRGAMVAKDALPYELGPPVAKLVLLTDLAAVDPPVVDCTFHLCPPGLLLWVVVTPVPYEPEGPIAAPVASGTPGHELVAFDAHTGVTLGTGETGPGLFPAYWASLVDYAP